MTGFAVAGAGILVMPAVLVAALLGGLADAHPPASAVHSVQMADAYMRAADTAAQDVGCAVPWQVLAAIAEVESGGGRGRKLGDGNRIEPLTLGPALDGRGGVRAIPDTDAGQWDGDASWDRAMGPMQFIPSSWRRFGQDGDGDGLADPHNPYDATLAAAMHLCLAPAPRGGPKDLNDSRQLNAALLAYNRSMTYVNRVVAIARSYAAPSDYGIPVDRARLTTAALFKPHHDYPAWDLPVPVGTSVHAVHGGVVVSVSRGGRCGVGVTIRGHDGYRYTYCHGSALSTSTGQAVSSGQSIMLSGDSGTSTGPHLHLYIADPNGQAVCPQSLLAAWSQGVQMHPAEAPRTGCVK